jgi:hypothetical protein
VEHISGVTVMIGENLLTQTADFYSYLGESEQGGASYGAKVVLTKVRVNKAKQMLMTALGEAKNDKLVLFYDCVLSLPTGTTFKTDDKIVYNSVDYRVREVIEARSESIIHHYKLALVGVDG